MKIISISLTLYCLVFCFLYSCQDKSTNTITRQNNKIDTSVFTIIRFQTTDKWMFENVKPASLNNVELLQLDSILKVCIEEHNKRQLVIYDSLVAANPQSNLRLINFIIDIKEYKRQYVPVINSKGDKEVWINSFCDDWGKDWRSEILIVEDGGNCYFNLIINLSDLSYRVFIVNGEA
jgi:hypothetical protein